MAVASAAGKVILLGEHAVVYGQPAIAVPLSDVRASAVVVPLPAGQGVWIAALDLERRVRATGEVRDPQLHPLAYTVRNTIEYLALGEPALEIRLSSALPIARGLGSGTAAATALVRALAQHAGRALAPEEVSALVYRTEVLLHAHPSGVDNTVVAYERPVVFRRGEPPQALRVARPLQLVIADTGVPAQTRDAVGAVRAAWEADPPRYEALFERIGALVEEARAAIARGDLLALGEAMRANQQALVTLEASSAELDRLVRAAEGAGALGAKLSGGGRGGCMLALVTPEARADVSDALRAAGAAQVLTTVVREESLEAEA